MIQNNKLYKTKPNYTNIYTCIHTYLYVKEINNTPYHRKKLKYNSWTGNSNPDSNLLSNTAFRGDTHWWSYWEP